MSGWFVGLVVLATVGTNRLDQLPALLQGPVTNLDLAWVVERGDEAVPALVKLAGDRQLPAVSRNLALVTLGHTLSNLTGPTNELAVPVLFESLGDNDANLRGAAAFAARYVRDARLVPALEPLLKDKPATQEQAVLALGTNGNDRHVLPILRLFLETDSAQFRYSCAYALAELAVDRGVDVATIVHSNTMAFGEARIGPAELLSVRLDELQKLRDDANQLATGYAAQREAACRELREKSRGRLPCDPLAGLAARATMAREWRGYLVRSFWRAPAATTSVPAKQ